MDETLIQKVILGAVPVLLAITLHEAAHGYVARRFGDNTAWMLGRVTLNPLKHIDPIGTVLIPLLLIFTHAPFLFGWAKPVPVNFANLRDPKRDMFWVAAAGPAANFLMAIGWAIIFRLTSTNPAFAYMAELGVLTNVILMVFNLLPIPPLDGGRIAVSLLPTRLAISLARVEPFGMLIIFALLAAHLLDPILMPFIDAVYHLLALVVG